MTKIGEYVDKELNKIINNSDVLVTGGTGSIGSQIVQQLLAYNPRTIRVFSNSENELFEMEERLYDEPRLRYLIGDIRSKDRVLTAMRGVKIVFHAAALKHVPICEYNPSEAKSVNVDGTENVFNAAIANNVRYLVNISTDKAVNPSCTMGTCKMMGERIITTAREYVPNLIACNVRFGNVLGSRGSILYKVRDHLKTGRKIGVTDEKMTRFVMTISDAVHLVLQAMVFAQGSETFILKMSRVKIGDLIRCAAQYFADLYKIGISLDDFLSGEPGRRPGEKLSEALLTEIEAETAYETDKMILLPAPTTTQGKLYIPHLMLSARPLSNKRYESGDGPFLTPEEILTLLRRVDL